MFKKLSICLLGFIVIFSSNIWAKDLANKTALMFTFDSLNLNCLYEPGVNISSSCTVGGKYWLNNNWALMLGVNTTYANLQYQDVGHYSDESYDYNYRVLVRGLGFNTRFEYHFYKNQNFSLYSGAGFAMDFQHAVIKLDGTENAQGYSEAFSYNIKGILGFEYWIGDNFSLSGQYELTVGHSKNKETANEPYNYNYSTDDTYFNFNTSRFYLAYYFN